MQSKFCKRYACLHKNTADFLALSECGRYPLAVTYMTQCVKYWIRLIQMPNYRYPKQCYNMLRSLASVGKINWAASVSSLLFKYGLGFVWEANTVGDASRFINQFRQRLADCSVQQWHSLVEESPKALHYKHFKSILEVETYLNIDLPFVYRKVLANFLSKMSFIFSFCVLHRTLSGKFILSQNGKILLQPHKNLCRAMFNHIYFLLLNTC